MDVLRKKKHLQQKGKNDLSNHYSLMRRWGHTDYFVPNFAQRANSQRLPIQ